MMGGLYRISEWIMRLSVINVLWVICSSPVLFLLLVGFTTPNIEGTNIFLTLLPLLVIVTPFTLFPATTAMFAVARKWVTGDEDVPLFKTYFSSYKENYLQSMIGGFLFVIIIAIIVINYRFYLTLEGLMQSLSMLFLVLGIFVLAAMVNFFSILVHLHMKILIVVKNALLISIGSPLNTIVLIICNGLIVYISLFQFTFLIPFFMGSLVASFSFWQFHRNFQNLQLKQQQLEAKEQQQLEEKEEQLIEIGKP